MNRLLALSAVAALGATATSTSAAVFVVQAQANSSSGGSALDTGLSFNAGDVLTVTSSTDDLWSAGALPRYSDGNGLVATRFATASDDSGQAPGTQIGADFGLWTQNGLSAPFGSLVGRIGGAYQLLGANFNGTAWNTGTLELFYWDSNSGDNFGDIAFDINGTAGAVPEPSTWAMLILGFGLIGGVMRRRRTRVTLSYS